jgi:hypothetical protein
MMITHSHDLAVAGGVVARVVFTGRGDPSDGQGSRDPYRWANLASHVGDDPEAVTRSRSRLAEGLGVAPDAMTFMHPDHGRGVAVVGAPTGIAAGQEIRDVDALVTTRRGLGLVALSADCVPVILVERRAAIVAAVHCGWRGLVLDVVGAALDSVLERAGSPDSVVALLGPAICGACYAVPAERVAEVAEVRPEAVAVARDGQPAIDLRAGLGARLTQAGVAVRTIGGCTAEDPSLYSHRRDRLTGRQGGAVALVGVAA